MSKIPVIISAILILVSGVYSLPVLSELMINEPGDRVLLEWIEIYNKSTFEIDLSDYTITINNDTLDLYYGMVVGPDDYALICRRLLPVDNSDCFEYRWGDSTGVWGDTETESYPAYEAVMSLPNSSGNVEIRLSDGSFADGYSWSESPDDGRSIERDNPQEISSGWHQCYDLDLATPGRENSHISDSSDGVVIELVRRIVSLSELNHIVNLTYYAPSGCEFRIEVFDDKALKVKTLLQESTSSVGSIDWDMKDDNNQRIRPGLYIFSITVSGTVNKTEVIPIAVAP